MTPLASVVITSRNRAFSLALALAHLQTQTYANQEIIVVDNDSSDCTPAVALAYGARRVCVPSRYGIGYCRAQGVDAARGSVIAFLDDDCIPDPGWLSAIVRRLMADPNIGLLGGQVVNVGFTGAKRNKGKTRHLRNGMLGFVDDPARAEYHGNMNLAFRRDAIDVVGNYDPFFNVMEEIDLAARMREAGFEVAYEHGARVRHYNRSAFFKHRHFFYGQQLMRLYFYFKHFPPSTASQWRRFARQEAALAKRDLVAGARYFAWVVVKRRWRQLPNALTALCNTVSARLAIPWLIYRARTSRNTYRNPN